jgi:hypothetical protein
MPNLFPWQRDSIQYSVSSRWINGDSILTLAFIAKREFSINSSCMLASNHYFSIHETVSIYKKIKPLKVDQHWFSPNPACMHLCILVMHRFKHLSGSRPSRLTPVQHPMHRFKLLLGFSPSRHAPVHYGHAPVQVSQTCFAPIQLQHAPVQ